MTSAFLVSVPRPAAPLQAICLPYAGGGASLYRDWPSAFGSDVEVVAMQLPGREYRINEPPVVDPEALAAEVQSVVDRPYVMYGHSMGGRLAYEILQRTRRSGARLPEALYVGACRPPDVTGDGPLDGLSKLTDDELVERLLAGGGLAAETAAEPELLALVLPALRADLGWLDAYVHEPRPPLPVPIVGFAGREDHAVPAAQLEGWARHTSKGFELNVLPGGHFFLHERLPDIVARIGRGPTGPAPTHRIPVGPDWSVWRDAMLRTTGFPATGLDDLSFPACAAAADAQDADDADDGEAFDKVFAEALATGSERVRRLAADPLFREAITWQNPGMLVTLDSLVRGNSHKQPSAVRRREVMVARYWQRYCAKNDTVGFFGPVGWTRIDDGQDAMITADPGPHLVRSRRTSFEDWALAAYGETLARDDAVRPSLRPVVQPHVAIRDREALEPPHPPVPLSAVEVATLQACDGTRTAAEVADHLVAEHGIAKRADGLLLLDRLAERGLARWDADLPMSPDAESVLAERIAAIVDETARFHAGQGLEALRTARDAVDDASGDPDRLAGALRALDTVFEERTGRAAARRPGQTYAGRGLCYQDTARDLDIVVGAGFVRDLAAPLDLLIRAARWLCAELAAAYDKALRELYESLAEESGTTEVNLAELWFLAQGLLFGTGERPVDAVVKAFQDRWSELFSSGDDGQRLEFTAAELAGDAARLFPVSATSRWSAARIHSPDLQICAESVDAVNRGDYFAVLGEMHAAWPTLDSSIFMPFHSAPGDLVTALETDLGRNRVRVLFPPDWPRSSGRLSFALAGPTDIQLGIGPTPGADRGRLVPAADLVVRVSDDGTTTAHAPDGRTWPLLEIFSDLLAMHAVDAFKLPTGSAHSPRITIDRLVVARETWRTTVEETGLATVTGDRARFLAARRWRARAGLPVRVFVRIGTEIKPVYVDFRAPLYVLSLCAFLRAARAEAGGAVGVTVTEMVPDPAQAWVPDADGRRYFSELRIQVSHHG